MDFSVCSCIITRVLIYNRVKFGLLNAPSCIRVLWWKIGSLVFLLDLSRLQHRFASQNRWYEWIYIWQLDYLVGNLLFIKILTVIIWNKSFPRIHHWMFSSWQILRYSWLMIYSFDCHGRMHHIFMLDTTFEWHDFSLFCLIYVWIL